MAKLRALIVADLAVVREGLRAILMTDPGLTVVGEATDDEDACAQAAAQRPDVVIMDLSMPGLHGIEATGRLLAVSPASKVIALTFHEEPVYMRDLLDAGVRGYVLKRSMIQDLLRAIHVVVNGAVFLDPQLARRSPAPDVEVPSLSADLSAQEIEVAALIARGHSNAEIADALVEVAVDLCRADTAGVSLLEGDVFRWEAVAGVFAGARGGTMPRNESPCGVCIDRDAVQLMHFADRCFPALVAEPRFAEALLIPFHQRGRPIGTVWVVSHTVDRKFDKEDERVLRVLSQFAAAGWQLWTAYGAADEANRRMDDVVATLDRRVVERTAEVQATNARLVLALAERTALEKARTEWLTTLMAAQEDERRRVARELHDEMGQHVSGLMLGLHSLEADSSSRDDAVRRLKNLVSDLERGVSRLSLGLRPTALDDLGITAALSSHVDEWSQQTGIAADFSSRNCEERLPAYLETTLYRIVQEALTNVARHAQARCASVVLERRPDCVVVIIDDDGCGFKTGASAAADGFGHFGLVGIRERAALLGGRATIESSATSGTSVFVHLPVRGQPDVVG